MGVHPVRKTARGWESWAGVLTFAPAISFKGPRTAWSGNEELLYGRIQLYRKTLPFLARLSWMLWLESMPVRGWARANWWLSCGGLQASQHHPRRLGVKQEKAIAQRLGFSEPGKSIAMMLERLTKGEVIRQRLVQCLSLHLLCQKPCDHNQLGVEIRRRGALT